MPMAALALGALLASRAAQASDPPICTDRPAKGNAVCTVPLGYFQLEASALDWSRLKQEGATNETLATGSTILKYGLTGSSDIQIGFTPYIRTRTDDGSNAETLSGVGDVLVRYKHRITATDAPVQVAAIPFAKLPTAKRGIGNRKVEGGLALPVSMSAGHLTVTLGPEVDVLADGDGHGRHFAALNLVNLAGNPAPRLTLIGELWSSLNFDPAGTIKQASANAAVAYAVSSRIQLDAGLNAGLTRETPNVQIYAGMSIRFPR